MKRENLTTSVACVIACLALIDARVARAGDDAGRLAGEWSCTTPINGQSVQFKMIDDGKETKIYAVTPTGNVMVRQANYTAADGQYKEDKARLSPAVSCTYKFTDDDTLSMTDGTGVTFLWHRAKSSTPASAANDKTTAAPRPEKATKPETPPKVDEKPDAPAPAAATTPQPVAAPAAPVEPAASASTSTPTLTAEEAADAVLIDTDLVHVPTGKTLIANFNKFSGRPVVGRPDLFFQTNTLLAAGDPPKRIASSPSSNHIWLAPDLRRVVFIHDGDVYRGEFDWLHEKFVNEKQLTTSGSFERAQLIVWHDNLLYLNAPISPEKPVVKIDLLTGQVTQLPAANIIGGGVTPDGRLIISFVPNRLTLFSTATGQTGSMSSTLAVPNDAGRPAQTDVFSAFGRPADRDPPYNPWLADEVGFTVLAQGGNGTSVLARADFEHGTGKVVATFPGEAVVKQVLPGKHFVDLAVTQASKDSKPQTQRLIVSLDDGTQTVLPVTADNGCWIDDHRFVYGVVQGDLQDLGVFVYSRADGKTTRIAERPASIYFDANPTARNGIYLPHCDTIVCSANTGETPLFAAKLDGSGAKKLPGSNAHRFNSEPVDLGLSGSPAPLWQPIAEAPTTAMPEAAPDPSLPGDERTVKAATASLPAEEQQRALKYYRSVHSAQLANFYDPAKVALKALAASRAGEQDLNVILTKLDMRDCVFKPSVYKFAIEQFEQIMNSQNFTDEQKRQASEAAAQEFTEKFMANPDLMKNNPANLMQSCFDHATERFKH